jgi:hypothetical protein
MIQQKKYNKIFMSCLIQSLNFKLLINASNFFKHRYYNFKMTSLSFDEKVALSEDKTSKYYVEDLNYQLVEQPEITDGYRFIDNSFTVPKFVKNLEITKKMQLRSDDTFVIGFPKSGTTWIEEIAWLLNNNLDYARSKSVPHFERVVFVETGFSDPFLEEMPSPRTFKSHLLPKYLPENFQNNSKVQFISLNSLFIQ